MGNGYINGREWKEIRGTDLCLYLSGRAQLGQTDGVVTLHVPEQPPIESRLTEGDNKRTLCAIARLVNENGSIRVERINQYFRGEEMDRAFGWGFAGPEVPNKRNDEGMRMSFSTK